jgi:hypothetical protein
MTRILIVLLAPSGLETKARVMWAGFLCKRVFSHFAKEKNRATWLESERDFPLKGRKFPLTWYGPKSAFLTIIAHYAFHSHLFSRVVILLKYCLYKFRGLGQNNVFVAILLQGPRICIESSSGLEMTRFKWCGAVFARSWSCLVIEFLTIVDGLPGPCYLVIIALWSRSHSRSHKKYCT